MICLFLRTLSDTRISSPPCGKMTGAGNASDKYSLFYLLALACYVIFCIFAAETGY